MSQWSSKNWKQKRDKYIEGKVCSWCGSDQNLSIHHLYDSKFKRNHIEKKIIRELIRQKMDDGSIPMQQKEISFFICPVCQNPGKITRKNQKTITCSVCQKKYDIKPRNIEKRMETNYFLSKDKYKQFIRDFKAEIDLKLKEENAPPKYDYMNFEENTIILCKKCHYATENGKNLCPICKKNYKSIRYETCFECLPEKKRNEIILAQEEDAKINFEHLLLDASVHAEYNEQLAKYYKDLKEISESDLSFVEKLIKARNID